MNDNRFTLEVYKEDKRFTRRSKTVQWGKNKLGKEGGEPRKQIVKNITKTAFFEIIIWVKLFIKCLISCKLHMSYLY